MLIIKTLEDINTLRASHKIPSTLMDLIEPRMRAVTLAFKDIVGYATTSEEYGTFHVVEPGDRPEENAIAGRNTKGGIPIGEAWEVTYYHPGLRAFEVHVVHHNGGQLFYVPDEQWLVTALRSFREQWATSGTAADETSRVASPVG